MNNCKDDHLQQFIAMVKKYLTLTEEIQSIRERMDYLTAKVFRTEYVRNVEVLKKKGAIAGTIDKLYRDPQINFLASYETHLEVTSSLEGYDSIKQMGEAMNLVSRLREDHNTAMKPLDFLKESIICAAKNLHETYSTSYRELVEEVNDPKFTYTLLRNWLYNGENNKRKAIPN